MMSSWAQTASKIRHQTLSPCLMVKKCHQDDARLYLQSKVLCGFVHSTSELLSGAWDALLQDADAAIDKFRRNSYSSVSASNAPEQPNGRSSQGSQVRMHTTA